MGVGAVGGCVLCLEGLDYGVLFCSGEFISAARCMAGRTWERGVGKKEGGGGGMVCLLYLPSSSSASGKSSSGSFSVG